MFSNVFQNGKKFYGGNFLCFLEKRGDNLIYYAVTAGKKKLKSAVKRNRAKRVLRAALEKYLQQKEISGVNIILVAIQDLTNANSNEISEKLMGLL